jgi:multimeric flavodoxin WrbA
VTADKVIFLSKVTKGFVSGNLKSLFDRMIPLFLPYTTFRTGESMHVQRYEKYPDIEFYYEGELQNENDREIFEDYIRRVFYQFYSEKITVKPIDVYSAKGV